MCQVGLAQATFEKVGNRLKMKAPHVAYYYPDREALLEGAIQFVVAKGQEATVARIEAAKSDREAVCAMADGAFDWLEDEPKYFTIMMLFYHLASYDRHYRELHSEMRNVAEERIQGLLDKIGSVEPKHRRKVAKDIHGLITGNLIGWATTKSSDDIKETRARTVDTILRMIEG